MTNASAGMSKSALLATGDPTGLAAEIAVQKTRALVNRAVWLQAALVLTLRRSEQVRRMIPRRVRGASADPDSAVAEALRSAVRLRLKNGSLPHPNSKVWGGTGSGNACVVCERPISANQVEYEVANGNGRLRSHLPCFLVWRAEAAQKDGT